MSLGLRMRAGCGGWRRLQGGIGIIADVILIVRWALVWTWTRSRNGSSRGQRRHHSCSARIHVVWLFASECFFPAAGQGDLPSGSCGRGQRAHGSSRRCRGRHRTWWWWWWPEGLRFYRRQGDVMVLLGRRRGHVVDPVEESVPDDIPGLGSIPTIRRAEEDMTMDCRIVRVFGVYLGMGMWLLVC